MSNHEFIFGEEVVDTSCEKIGNNLKVTVGESEFVFEPVGRNLFATTLNGAKCVIGAAEDQGTYYIDVDSILLELKEPSEDGFAGGAGGQAGEKDKILAPMPGKIVKIQVAVGDEVVEKQPMVIVEAMKMEHQVVARANGKVKAVNFSDGDQVDTESPIIELELAAEE